MRRPRALQWILTSFAQAAQKAPGKFQRLFRTWEKRLGKSEVVLAVAHEMLSVIFAKLARNESYSEQRLEPTREKIMSMRPKVRGLRTRVGVTQCPGPPSRAAPIRSWVAG